MPTPWNADPPGSAPLIRLNAARTLRLVRQHAQSGNAPTLADAQQWHRELYQGVTLPVPYYAGEFRDSDQRFPELIDYQVSIGRFAGLAARDVPAALQAFEGAMQTSVQRLDNGLGVNTKPTTAPDLTSVVMLAAASHGEWIRIHPFANGNGRTARLWGNWSLLRYGLPPVLRVKPLQAGIAYAVAAEYSMSSDHRPMFDVILSELNSRI